MLSGATINCRIIINKLVTIHQIITSIRNPTYKVILRLQFNIKNKSTKVPSLQQVFKLSGSLKIIESPLNRKSTNHHERSNCIPNKRNQTEQKKHHMDESMKWGWEKWSKYRTMWKRSSKETLAKVLVEEGRQLRRAAEAAGFIIRVLFSLCYMAVEGGTYEYAAVENNF